MPDSRSQAALSGRGLRCDARLRHGGATPCVTVHSVISLSQLLDRHPSILLLDAASAVVHAAWLRRDASPQWVRTREEAGRGLFALVEELGPDCLNAEAFIYCEGPGSILGIRTTATALRTWQALRPRPTYAYRSLELTAQTHGAPGDTVICDARRQSWHAISVTTDGSTGAIDRIPTAELAPSSRLLMPADFRTWSALPDPAPETVPYDPAALLATLADQSLFEERPEPDAFLHEDPSYVRWTPAVHRAPEPKP